MIFCSREHLFTSERLVSSPPVLTVFRRLPGRPGSPGSTVGRRRRPPRPAGQALPTVAGAVPTVPASASTACPTGVDRMGCRRPPPASTVPASWTPARDLPAPAGVDRMPCRPIGRPCPPSAAPTSTLPASTVLPGRPASTVAGVDRARFPGRSHLTEIRRGAESGPPSGNELKRGLIRRPVIETFLVSNKTGQGLNDPPVSISGKFHRRRDCRPSTVGGNRFQYNTGSPWQAGRHVPTATPSEPRGMRTPTTSH